MIAAAGTNPSVLILLAGAALIAGLSRGFSGFGAALIFVPLAGALVGPKLGATTLLVADGIFASYMVPGALRLADKRAVGLMFVGAMVGVPAGTAVLSTYPALTLRWLIAGIAAAMLTLLLSGWRYRGRPHPAATVLVGGVSGVFSGIAQIGGPPVISYWLGGENTPAQVRANIILYFACSSLLSLASYLWAGLLTRQVLILALCAGPAYALGTFAGTHLFGRASPAVFRGASLALIAAAVLISLPIV